MIHARHGRPGLRFVTGLLLVSAAAGGCGARIDPPLAAPATGAAAASVGAPQGDSGSSEPTGTADAGPAAVPAPGSEPTNAPASGSGSAPPAAAGAASSPSRAVTPGQGTAPVAARPTGQAGPGTGGSPAGGSSQPAGSKPATPGTDPPDAVRIAGRNSQGVSDTEIKVGVMAPLSGAAGFLGELEVDAIKAFFADANAKGGVRGRKYRIVTADTRFEPPTEATAARRLVEDEKVFALFSLLGDTTAQYATTRGVPTIVYGGNPVSFSSKYPNVYPVGWNVVGTNATFAYILTQVMKLPIKTVALAYETTNIPWGPWAKYAQKAWEAYGIEVKSLDRFNLSDGDCTQLVLKVRNLGVDFWDVGQTLGWPLCQQAMARQNYTPKYGRGGPMTDDINFTGQVGQAADGLYAMTNRVQILKNKGQPWPWNDAHAAPEADHFADSMRRFSPKSANDAGLEALWSQSFWASAKLLNEGLLRQTEAVTWQGFNQWAQAQRPWNSGLVAPSSFDPKCKTGASALWIFQYKWDGSGVRPSDWQPYGGFQTVPTEIMDKIVPGAGKCYLTAMADAEL
ncbi:MAG: branched-chain amino acid transport system substrate-binding protein [Actinomycetota bacterium]|nr:branched-chain amino acid transport system substrate-binding protein [Actinomycetota bacterium]MDQ1568474.1 branched-chain amino acid transport system substrate-binding protein [Actinomycetota bacterium]